ncbi:MAG: site-specific DNA-methyltransferase [Gammaproteobacteria bacterium]|nr:site-specific DNA-methyltransferase [Gammaproteobacteria bacterium]
MVDFDMLRQELSNHIVEGPRERYQLNWPGKKESILSANTPLTLSLRPDTRESIDFFKTSNLFIEGDNLDALKLIQENYFKKVKLIYIDPPYNTGRNLIYKNNYMESSNSYESRTGQLHYSQGRLVSNPETNGRFHSEWLSMIYSRIKLAKSLLREDGILVCAIDENEFATLSVVIKEIFGEGIYEYGYVSVVHNPRGQQGTNFSYVNEYLIYVYPANQAKSIADFQKKDVDSRNLRDSGKESDRTDAKNCFYPFIVSDKKIVSIGQIPSTTFHPASANVRLENGCIEVWPINEQGKEKKWRYARHTVSSILDRLEPKMGRTSVQIIFHKDTETMRSVWSDSKYDSSEYGTKLLEEIIPHAGFTYPKSLWAVYDAVFSGTFDCKDAIVLDFFAGSSTTAHAVMELNSADGGNRSFVMIQFPAEVKPSKGVENFKFRTIADISKERIRKCGKKILERDSCHSNWNKDVGFRVLKVDSSNMKDVFYQPDDLAQEDLLESVDYIKEDRSAEDLLFQVLVDWGVDLTLPIQKEKLHGKAVFFVDENALVACFEKEIGEDLVKDLAQRNPAPLRVVFRDNGFVSDAVKINVEQIFRQLSPTTEVRTI